MYLLQKKMNGIIKIHILYKIFLFDSSMSLGEIQKPQRTDIVTECSKEEVRNFYDTIYLQIS